MKKYKSHKVVEAAKIVDMSPLSGSVTCLHFEDGTERNVPRRFFKNVPPINEHDHDLGNTIGGYYVRYEDGYESWSPAKAFEEGYTEIDEGVTLTPNNRVLPEDIERLIERSKTSEHVFWGKELVVSMRLPCGFTVTGRGACVDPFNFDRDKGYAVAMEQIKNQLWQLEGYLLQNRLYNDGTLG